MDDFLQHMIAEITKQHQTLEIECTILKDLLKPWPKKKYVIEKSENKEKEVALSEVQKPTDNFSQEERQALTQVEKLLQKAEKTLILKSKVKQDVGQGTNLDIQKNTPTDVKNSDTQELSYNTSIPNSWGTNADVDMKISNPSAKTLCPPSSKVETLSNKTSKIQLLESNNNLTGRKHIFSRKNISETNEKTQNSLTTSTRPLSSHRPPSSQPPTSNKSTSSRPSSSHKPPSSQPLTSNRTPSSRSPKSHKPPNSQVHHVPAHMLAPFKTSNSSSFSKQKKTLSQNHVNSTRTVKSVPIEVKKCQALPKILAINHKKQEHVADTCMNSLNPTAFCNIESTKEIYTVFHTDSNNTDNNDNENLEGHQNLQMSASNSNSNCNSDSSLKISADQSVDISSSHTPSIDRNQTSKDLQKLTSNLRDPEQDQFTLKKNGSTIKLPSKLIKLVNVNRSLQEKLSGMKEKIIQVDSAQQFVEKLSSQEEISKELRTRVSALSCLRYHNILMDTLQSLQLNKLSESTPMEVLYKAKKMLEFVLTTFAELEEETDYYSKVKYRKIPPVQDFNKGPSEEQGALWLDTSQHRDLQGDVKDHLQQSKQWAHLQFTEKYLEFNIHLVKTAQTEWWKSLLSLNRDTAVLQGVYGLLTTHGQFIPAFVENPHVI